MFNLLIRADASIQTGTGHLMRCLALAHACQARGGEVIFLSRCGSYALRQHLQALGFTVVALEEEHPAPVDLRTTLSLLAQLTADKWRSAPVFLVLDGYHFDSAYQRAAQEEGHQLLVIDDTGRLPHYHADVLLNHGLHAPRIPYQYDVKTIPLLGPRYALLRPEFLVWREWRREIPEVARHVLITLGGSDPRNTTQHVLHALAKLTEPDLEVRVVIGPANPWRDELQQTARKMACRVQLLTNVNDMAHVMAWADVAVSAGGGSCWELAFMGAPMFTMVLADNQLGVANALNECGIGINLGSAADLRPERFTEELRTLLHDRVRRSRMSALGRVAVDGYGVERVVTLLARLQADQKDEAIQLRPATQADAGLLWQWANDPLTRANSFHGEMIAWDQHVDWYEAKLRAPGTRIWILEYLGVPAGQIRYDRLVSDLAQISYLVAPGWRGKGIGTQLLVRSSPLACAELNVQRLQGVTFTSNTASAQAFRRAGYQLVKEEGIEGRPCLVFAWTRSEPMENEG
jgi:UDP-2,4-diacetamido-2,4,6-trideoxy-beta-L-altropyranose hydrolase